VENTDCILCPKPLIDMKGCGDKTLSTLIIIKINSTYKRVLLLSPIFENLKKEGKDVTAILVILRH